VLATGDPALPTAADCATPGTADGAGFTDCLRQLAGDAPDGQECGAGDPALDTFPGPSVTCDLGAPYRVSYTHAASAPADQVLAAAAARTTAARVEAEWSGNGLRGRYVSTVEDGRGLLVFAVADRPLFGALTAEGADLTPDALADYFEREVQPGT
ncbi:MAG TPA: Hsp70 family protein, partial [Pseudonocardiaceae bacterium]